LKNVPFLQQASATLRAKERAVQVFLAALITLSHRTKGIRFSSHDPSDEGPDLKGFAFRHGSVVLDVREKINGNINEGCDWATGLAIQYNSDAFTWDCDGMGVGLNQQVTEAFDGHHTVIAQYKGSEGVDFPEAIFEPAGGAPVQGQKTNKQALKNKRAQYYWELRSKVYRTHKAIHGEYSDPDKLISFDSQIKCLTQLRSELCRMPIKPNRNGLFELYTKQEMKTKFKFQSPNLADSVKMLGRVPHLPTKNIVCRPTPIRVMGRR
jgi:phage terminase large subunit